MRRLLPLTLLLLSGCLNFSPLRATDTVAIEGRLDAADGSAAANTEITLVPPGLASGHRARTNAAGVYRFSLPGSELQFLGVTAEATIRAEGPDGTRVSQRFQPLKTQISLPAMRFWNSLRSPAAAAQLSGERAEFSWEPPPGSVHDYALRLRDARGDTVWLSRSNLPSLEIPLAAMAPHQTYSWDVEADFGDYTAGSARRDLQANPGLKSLPIRSIHLADSDRDLAELHDGDYGHTTPLKLTPAAGGATAGQGQLQLVVELEQPARIRGLHWAGATVFGTALQIRTAPTAAALLSQALPAYALPTWEPVTASRLYLQLSGDPAFDIPAEEIRLLGD